MTLTESPITELAQMWSYPFMVNAFRAGTIVAVLAGAMGWFMVLRRQSFAGHTLSVIGFPGAAGAVLIGVAASYGYFAFCVAGALVIAALPQAGRGGYPEESAVTGTVQAFALACGFLFVSLYKGFLNGINALLFGNFLGITTGQVTLLGVVAAV
ncbi:MAG: metal ABC transporter permease, partial [Pseudonocardiaceae bacterium]